MMLYGGRCIECGRVVILDSSNDDARIDAGRGNVYCKDCGVFSDCRLVQGVYDSYDDAVKAQRAAFVSAVTARTA